MSAAVNIGPNNHNSSATSPFSVKERENFKQEGDILKQLTSLYVSDYTYNCTKLVSNFITNSKYFTQHV
jgi:hypothetical protein